MRTTPHERLLLKVGEGFVIRRERVNHLKTRTTMKCETRQEDVPEGALAKCCELRWLAPRGVDPLWDTVVYEATDEGLRQLRRLWDAEGEKR